ncbi:MAG TPA: cell envelope biogenesis protein TolA [Myxococcaceae bacterium]|nr:cell envelope biogenesis protein TolA [Myxococcaceae bacterium]
MLYALILVSVALAITLGMLLLGYARGGEDHLNAQQKLDAEAKARVKAESELEKKRKDLDEHRTQLTEAKEQLKQAKRKLFDQKESDKGGQDLVKARAEVERNASTQLEVVRNELAQALHEVERLRAEMAGKGRRPPEKPVEKPSEKPVEKVEAAPEPKKYRELSDADREKMERLEHEASRERAKSQELDREVKRLKGRVETHNRVYLVTKGELDLVKDKFKALEKRLNRTLLENDLVRRAIGELAKQSGIAAGRTELTADEIAASDRNVDEKVEASKPAPTTDVAAVAEPNPPEPEQARPA